MMAGLSPTAQDRLFFLGIGLTSCAIIALMRRMLVSYKESAVTPPSLGKAQYITQDVEDSLKPSTLWKLLESSNYSIQETTAIIICERALHDGTTLDILLQYITRRSYEKREKGIRALTMMMNSSTVSMITKPKTYAALVKCLEYCVTESEHNQYDPEWDNWHFRDVVEQGCLTMLAQLIANNGVEGVIKAKFIEKWLVKEPWARPEDNDNERQFQFMDSLTKVYRLNEICLPLFRDHEGKKALQAAKLLPGGKLDYDDSALEMETKLTNGEGTAGEDFDGMFVDSRRPRDQSSEDEHLRRRHREAMVLNDGTRPFERGDIIERER